MSGFDTLVVGLGSIGTRHVRVLNALGRRLATISRRQGGDFPDLDRALAEGMPDYVVVATETAAHAETLESLARHGFSGTVLVEKPLLPDPGPLPAHAFDRLLVGYNLRFHPVLRRVAELLQGQRLLTAQAYVGQYLPDWRPGRDHRGTASASVAAGGGVLRDLSHEFDFLLWLLGDWRRVAALGGRLTDLTIDSDDAAVLLLECERCPAVSVQLNYFDRPGARDLIVNTERHTIRADLVRCVVEVDGAAEHLPCARDDTYEALHRAALSGAAGPCTAEEGLAVVSLISAAEQAVETKQWVQQ
jgi:predicted dehydrogenase